MGPRRSTVDADALQSFYERVFAACGLPNGAAQISARALAFADLRGTESHGGANLERIYLTQLRDGTIDAAATPRTVADHGATAVIDGDRAIGFAAAHAAMSEAIERAGRFGVGAVGVRNSTHCGSMAFYTQLAVDAGMLGLAFTNLGGQRIVRPPGGALPLVGTNVIAAAAPAGTRPCFSLDMSAAAASTGRLRAHAASGEDVPTGWLVDQHGGPVRDARAFFTGSAHLQFLGGDEPAGGYKGFGLALLADVLCGTLLDGEVGPQPSALTEGTDNDGGIGHFMLAIDIAAFRDLSGFREDLDVLLGVLVGSPPRQGHERVLYPGLREGEAAASDCVTVSQDVLASLRRVGEALHVDVDALASPRPRPARTAHRSEEHAQAVLDQES